LQTNPVIPTLGQGAYTIPDAAQILNIPQPTLRRWVAGYWRVSEAEKRRVFPAETLALWGQGADRAFNFYTLIEVFVIARLREQGLTFRTIRQARQELAQRLKTDYPFASHELLHDGKRLLIEMDDKTLLQLGTQGQTAFERIIGPFCKKLDFCKETQLANRYWPMGKNSAVVVDPRHGFGRPTIAGTNIATETVHDLYRAGEGKETICDLYDLPLSHVDEALNFEMQKAA
jgi:uncharacterized protein (DUF433 family)/DNA-binding transcriptional MerR regulator